MQTKDFRNRDLAEKAALKIKEIAAGLGNVKIMHVCGTHEDTIGRFGIRSMLPENVEVISGPGCPVCVTTTREIDESIALAEKGVTVTTFGDMLRVPGSSGDLAGCKADGCDVRVVYSPSDAVKIAKKDPSLDVAHIAIGFETTVPTTAAELLSAPENFSVLCCHRTIPAALDLLLGSGDVRVDGFIDPGHVSAIIGVEPYRLLAEKYKMPHVVVGFEPLDMLFSLIVLLENIRDKRNDVVNEYSRVVRDEGNTRALALIEKVFRPCDVSWRGFPVIPGSGLALKDEYEGFDARKKFDIDVKPAKEPAGCRCGDVLKGLIYPESCPLFGSACTPDKPVGPCMVSSEGSCAIRFRYREEWKK